MPEVDILNCRGQGRCHEPLWSRQSHQQRFRGNALVCRRLCGLAPGKPSCCYTRSARCAGAAVMSSSVTGATELLTISVAVRLYRIGCGEAARHGAATPGAQCARWPTGGGELEEVNWIYTGSSSGLSRLGTLNLSKYASVKYTSIMSASPTEVPIKPQHLFDRDAEWTGLGRVPWIFEAGSCRPVRCLIA